LLKYLLLSFCIFDIKKNYHLSTKIEEKYPIFHIRHFLRISIRLQKEGVLIEHSFNRFRDFVGKNGCIRRELKYSMRYKVEYTYEVINKTNIQIDAEILYSAFLKVIDNMAEYKDKIDVIVPCVFSPALIAMDKDGNPLYPAIIHLDRRSYPQSEFAIKAVGKYMQPVEFLLNLIQ